MQQRSFLDGSDLVLAPHNGSQTSRAAAAEIQQFSNNLRERVYRFIAARESGATIDEIARGLGILTATVCGRTSELKKQGRIVDSGRTRKTRSGRDAVVLCAREARDGS